MPHKHEYSLASALADKILSGVDADTVLALSPPPPGTVTIQHARVARLMADTKHDEVHSGLQTRIEDFFSTTETRPYHADNDDGPSLPMRPQACLALSKQLSHYLKSEGYSSTPQRVYDCIQGISAAIAQR